MVMDAILTGLLKNPEIIEDGVCQNYVKYLYSPNTSPIFRTTVLGKITFDENNLDIFDFCNMGGNCYQHDCNMSRVPKRFSYENLEKFETVPKYTTINQFLEELFRRLQIKKEGMCESYMRTPASLPSKMSRLISKYKTKISTTPNGKTKINIFYSCNIRNSCNQPSCCWSSPSILESSLNRRNGVVERLGPFASLDI